MNAVGLWDWILKKSMKTLLAPLGENARRPFLEPLTLPTDPKPTVGGTK